MNQKRKPKTKPHPLSAAVKRVRQSMGLSQEKFAQFTGIATQTISRFELGKQAPRDSDVLIKLRDAAADAGLADEERLFQRAHMERHPHMYEERDGELLLRQEQPAYREPTPVQWRLMQMGRIAALFFPEAARAMEKAAGPAQEIVDEVIGKSLPDALDVNALPYSDMESQIDDLATRRALQGFRKERQ